MNRRAFYFGNAYRGRITTDIPGRTIYGRTYAHSPLYLFTQDEVKNENTVESGVTDPENPGKPMPKPNTKIRTLDNQLVVGHGAESEDSSESEPETTWHVGHDLEEEEGWGEDGMEDEEGEEDGQTYDADVQNSKKGENGETEDKESKTNADHKDTKAGSSNNKNKKSKSHGPNAKVAKVQGLGVKRDQSEIDSALETLLNKTPMPVSELKWNKKPKLGSKLNIV